MAFREVRIHLQDKVDEVLEALGKMDEALHISTSTDKEKRAVCSVLVKTPESQEIIDKVQGFMGKGVKYDYKITVFPVEALLPRKKEENSEKPTNGNKGFFGISREELYEDVNRNSTVNMNFMLMVVFSTIVAAIGLLENNVAAVIGAMVIAPLLGPNIALALATALGDTELAKRALISNGAGIITCLILSIGIGYYWPYGFESHELMSRTTVKYDGIALAIASGAAAVLSLTAGISSALVGVMVAVALLPPAVTFGIMLGGGEYHAATGAAILLAVNIVCVNLSAKVVLWAKGIKPNHWWEKKRASRAMAWYIAMWLLSLAILVGLMYLRLDKNVG